MPERIAGVRLDRARSVLGMLYRTKPGIAANAADLFTAELDDLERLLDGEGHRRVPPAPSEWSPADLHPARVGRGKRLPVR